MASSIPTFARTEPPDTQVNRRSVYLCVCECEFKHRTVTQWFIWTYKIKVTKSVISLLHYYGWKKFSIIYEESSTTVAKSLTEQAKTKNMTINHFQQVIDNHKCCEQNLLCCRSSYWHQVSVCVLRWWSWFFSWRWLSEKNYSFQIVKNR